MSHSRDVTGRQKSSSAQASSESLDIDQDWRIQVTQANIDPKGQWQTSCSSTGECWCWTSSKLFVYEQKSLRQIQVHLNQNEYIINASPLSNGIGWVVTTTGLFQISNFGANWIHIAVPDFDGLKGRIYSVHFKDGTRGWIAGGVYRSLADHEVAPNNALSDYQRQVLVGAVAKTRDGGLNWETIRFEKAIGRFSEIVFSQQFGLASGDAGLRSTADGGETWKDVLSGRRNLYDRTQVNATFLLDERHALAIIDGSNLLITDDGAKTWRMIPTPADSEQDIPPFAEVAFIDERRGLALHNQLAAGQIYKTNDGGKTWGRLELNTRLSGLVLVPGNKEIIAVGEARLYSFTPK